jgi:hypothetical protein
MSRQNRDSEENSMEKIDGHALHLSEARQAPERELSMPEGSTSQISHGMMNHQISSSTTITTTNIEQTVEGREAPSSISGLPGPEESRVPSDSHSGSEDDSSIPSIVDEDSDNADLE